MTKQAIQMVDATVAYKQGVALDRLTVSIPEGSRCAIVGPNGAGKSTLFKAILGLVPLREGSVELLGHSSHIDKVIQKQVAYIPQASEVNWQFPATVFDIVLMGRFPHIKGVLKKPTAQDRDIALKAMERMALLELRDRQISELSGGQRQRVFIARALAQEATLYLMDEPLAGIDIKTEALIMETLREFQNEGKTSIVIHHDLQTVESYFDYMVWVNKTAIDSGPVSEVFTQSNYEKAYQSLAQPATFRKAGCSNAS